MVGLVLHFQCTQRFPSKAVELKQSNPNQFRPDLQQLPQRDGLTKRRAAIHEGFIEAAVRNRYDSFQNECPGTTESPQAMIQYSTCNFYT